MQGPWPPFKGLSHEGCVLRGMGHAKSSYSGFLTKSMQPATELLCAESQTEVDEWGPGSLSASAATAALEAAQQSYAPYSRCPAGLAIVTAKGGVYSGPYLESAAYNPSLPPLQTAIVDAVIDGMPAYAEVGCPCPGHQTLYAGVGQKRAGVIAKREALGDRVGKCCGMGCSYCAGPFACLGGALYELANRDWSLRTLVCVRDHSLHQRLLRLGLDDRFGGALTGA
jgi:hypothetical protein